MRGIGEQREASGHEAAYHLGDQKRCGEAEHDRKRPLVPLGSASVVHPVRVAFV